jgi:hypothetical protein
MVSYSLLFAQAGVTNQPVLCAPLLTVPTLAIDAKILVPGKAHWVRVGWVEAVAVAQVGSGTQLVAGQPLRVVEGLHEFEIPTPDLPYQLRFIPREWMTSWSIEVYERIIEPTTEPVNLDSALIYQKLQDLEAKIDAL